MQIIRHSTFHDPLSREAVEGPPSLFRARHTPLSQPVVVAWIIACGMIIGLTLGLVWKVGLQTLWFGVPVCLICIGVATVIVAWNSRFMGVQIDPAGVAWRVRFGRDFHVGWDEVSRIVLLTSGGRKAGFQLETESGSFVIAPAEFQNSSRLASALSQQAALIGAATISRERMRERT